jgi:hypothetical protein
MCVRKVIVWFIQKIHHQSDEYSMADFDLSKAKPRNRSVVLAISVFQFHRIHLRVVGGTRLCFDANSPMVVEK